MDPSPHVVFAAFVTSCPGRTGTWCCLIKFDLTLFVFGTLADPGASSNQIRCDFCAVFEDTWVSCLVIIQTYIEVKFGIENFMFLILSSRLACMHALSGQDIAFDALSISKRSRKFKIQTPRKFVFVWIFTVNASRCIIEFDLIPADRIIKT